MVNEKQDIAKTGKVDKVSTGGLGASIDQLVGEAKSETRSIVAAEIAQVPCDVHGFAEIAIHFYQALAILLFLSVSQAYRYDAEGNRTDETRGMYVTLGAFGGKLRVLVPDADEQTFQDFHRGARVRLVNPEVRVTVPHGAYTPSMSVSAADIEMVV